MKKILVLLSLLISCSAWADAKDVLQERLAKVDGFYAQFKQTVNTADHQLIQEGKGELWVKRPNLFNWQINEPDNTSIISDGIDIWIYTPAVEQLTVMSLAQAVDNRLLLLITDPKSHVWQDYQVKREQNHFTLQPLDKSQQSYKISVLPTGMI
ncbi:outer membrane lipoprotein carrier protein, partial [Frischella perrara]